ncbi:hypothetical protein AQUCO_03200021v1 [Aquilegia coerulea]|uniref:Stigma-specific protein Stig1 n=1 Tax=Aquilegia coerulea TaxID=218851 RepID=A0A2G5D0Q1_AQUCA|nr:hypothetical protein AQUCO_03200021v1 [Aquilegia coerulea]
MSKVVVSSTTDSSVSPWLKRVTKPRTPGCFHLRCKKQGQFPPDSRVLYCKNRCANVISDANNCGLCGIRCPFTWHCCKGLCINTNANPFHCGKCENSCGFGVLCFYGMCVHPHPPLYPQPPFPFPPLHPYPPLPFPPLHPRPPYPFPPLQPHPRPPFPFPQKLPYCPPKPSKTSKH